MPIDSKHKEYKFWEADWLMISDFLAGERTIKERGTLYLPKLGGQINEEYKTYKNRPALYNAFGKTISGMGGTVVRKEPVITIPKGMESYLEHFTVYGGSFQEFIQIIIMETLGYGRSGALLDRDGISGNPYAAIYSALDIYNWDYEYVAGKEKLTMLILRETYFDTTIDKYDPTEVERVRILEIDEDGYLVVSLFQATDITHGIQNWALADDIMYPTFPGGKRLNYIPFKFFGPISSRITPEKPPLLDLLYLCLNHWKMSADLAHGLHFCALPTPWAAGFPTDKQLFIGPTHAWVSDDPAARCGYLEITGEGLKPLMEELERREYQMAALGARMLERPRKGIESAEALRLRQTAESASLSTFVDSLSTAFTELLRMYCDLIDMPGQPLVSLSKDFVDTQVDHRQVTVLLQSLQAGAISQDTFLYNLQVGEVLPPERTIEEEKKLISKELANKTVKVEAFTEDENINIDAMSDNQNEATI